MNKPTYGMAVFEITEQHIKLLRAAYVDWNESETGAPCIDPKRPYGNSGVAGDIAKILGVKLPDHDDGAAAEEAYEVACEELMRIHRETLPTLQIMLAVGYMKPGRYLKVNRYDDTSWVPE